LSTADNQWWRRDETSKKSLYSWVSQPPEFRDSMVHRYTHAFAGYTEVNYCFELALRNRSWYNKSIWL